ncbi:MAG: radical SAM protein, partial [Thermoplasmatota archaeon]
EKRCSSEEEVIDEANSIDASGTGITGGDPLLTDKTVKFIRLLKDEFGEGHHIHLYTQSTDIKKIEKVADAGLDEIRFHPPTEVWDEIEETEYPEAIKKSKELGMDVGVEIPAIPELKGEMKKLINDLSTSLDFVNLNELEFSSTNWKELVKRGYKEKSDVSSAVKGSQEAAMNILKDDLDVPVHYCSASFKDGVQLTNRIKRRAEKTARDGEIITEEGTIIKGVIESEEPRELVNRLKDYYGVDSDMVWYNGEEHRAEAYILFLEDICYELDEMCYGVEVYPTADRLEVERWPLKELRYDGR